MPDTESDSISLIGLDWCHKLREVDIDLVLWQRMCDWNGNEADALTWVQTQIKLFSSRHPQRHSLSHIISSIAFVEMSKLDKSRHLPVTRTRLSHDEQMNLGASKL